MMTVCDSLSQTQKKCRSYLFSQCKLDYIRFFQCCIWITYRYFVYFKCILHTFVNGVKMPMSAYTLCVSNEEVKVVDA